MVDRDLSRAALVIMVLAINLLGDWLRDALNPKLLRSDDGRCSRSSTSGSSSRPAAACWSRSTTCRFRIAPGEVLGVVGESGAGKSLTGAAIIGLIDPPGRIAAGQILLDGRRIDNLPAEAMRRVRGREIGAIFQDPLTSLNPLYTIGRQLIETIRRTSTCRRRQARRARARAARGSRHLRRRSGASTTIRTSSPAACASAW